MAYDDTATVSGSVVSIDNGADEVGAKSCVVTLPASLDGYSSVDVLNTGKNFLDDTLANLEQGSINGSTGANENANNRVRTINAIPFPYDKIASSYSWTIPSGYKVAIRPYDANGNFVQLPSWALAFIIQLPTDLIGQGITQMKFVLAKNDNTAITPSDIANIGFQIEVGSTATTYEPYTSPTTHTATLGRTIYGGTADIVKGEGTETFARIDMGDLTWQYDSANTRFFTVGLTSVIEKGSSGWKTELVTDLYTTASGTANDKTISEYASTGYVYIKDTDYSDPATFKASLSGKYLTYPLATPTDFTFEPVEINSRLGSNTMWSEQGNIELTYYKSGYGFTSVTVHKETPNGEPVVQTVKFHKIVYGGQADVVKGTCEPKNLLANLGTFPYSSSATAYYFDFTTKVQARKIPTFRLQADVDYSLSMDVECDNEPFNISVGCGKDGSYQKDINTLYSQSSGRCSISFSVNQDFIDSYGDIFAFRVPRYGGSTHTFNVTIDNVQLEIGSTASDFAPYFDPFTFPPISMETDDGENTLFATEGDSSITYRKAVD